MTDKPKDRLAVALHYEKPRAPRVVAVGRGWVGQRIIDIADENNVPVRENSALAEALAKVELDEEIPEESLPRGRTGLGLHPARSGAFALVSCVGNVIKTQPRELARGALRASHRVEICYTAHDLHRLQ